MIFNFSDKHHFVSIVIKTFPLKNNLMKPYSKKDASMNTDQKMYNCRYLVADASQNIYSRYLNYFSDSFRLTLIYHQAIILAGCHLQNYLREQRDRKFINMGSMDCEDIYTVSIPSVSGDKTRRN
jgi:hypothetical protein